MALSLGVRKNQRIKIGESVLTVLEIVSSAIVRISFGGKEYLVSDLERVKLGDEIYVQVGLSPTGATRYTRLAFEAPRRIKINRLDVAHAA